MQKTDPPKAVDLLLKTLGFAAPASHAAAAADRLPAASSAARSANAHALSAATPAPESHGDEKAVPVCVLCGALEAVECCAVGHCVCDPCLGAYVRGCEKACQAKPTCPVVECVALLVRGEEKPAVPRLARIGRLRQSDPEYNMVVKKFAETMSADRVVDIFRISNPPLRSLFEACRARMTKEGRLTSDEKDIGANEQFLFHATSRTAAGGIIREGFDMRRAGSRFGSALGPGIYLAPDAAFADRYSALDSVAKRSMLLCRVLLGDTNGRDSRMAHQTDAEGKSRPQQYCVGRECQVLPTYLLHYK